MPDLSKKVLVLGVNGFVGKNIALTLSKEFDTITSSRKHDAVGSIYFDLSNRETWKTVFNMQADVIINCIGYGVIKGQQDIEKTFRTNYLDTVAFYEFLMLDPKKTFILHIGTAFEYDLSQKRLNEKSPTLPLTYYGMSKYMASNYLFHKFDCKKYTILRPFNMFGDYEDYSKIIPSLILAQKEKKAIQLSHGLQKRDYFHINDLALFIIELLKNENLNYIPNCINVGSGKSISIREMANYLIPHLPRYDPALWNWGAIESRQGETDEFFNASVIAEKLGFKVTDLNSKLKETVSYYWNL